MSPEGLASAIAPAATVVRVAVIAPVDLDRSLHARVGDAVHVGVVTPEDFLVFWLGVVVEADVELEVAGLVGDAERVRVLVAALSSLYFSPGRGWPFLRRALPSIE